MRAKGLITAIMACSMVGLGAPLMAVTPAFAAGCYSSGCTGLDPVAEGCSGDPTTIASNSEDGFTIEIRYSGACHAVWARATSAPVSDGPNEAEIFGWPCNVAGGKRCSATIEDYTAQYSQVWSNMVSSSLYLQACTDFYTSNGRLCTGLIFG